MKNLFLAAIAALLLLSSCSKVFYQVYNTEAPGMKEEGSSLVYENEDCKLMYNLWDEDGSAGFVIHNKTTENLFLVLSQTFFIKNGIAFDFFKNSERSHTELVGSTSSAGFSGTIYGLTNIWGTWYNANKTANLGVAKSKGYSLTVTTKDAPIVCIPANSSKFIEGYSISDRLIKNCNKGQAYPKRKSAPVYFTKEDTPLSFRNRIAYSFDSSGDNLKQIENEFWVSEVINYTEKESLDKKEYSECEGDLSEIVYVFRMASPRKFYNSYKGVSKAQNKTNRDVVVEWN